MPLPANIPQPNYYSSFFGFNVSGPLFSNNAQVFYKPGSQPAGGIGTVRNSHTRAKRLG